MLLRAGRRLHGKSCGTSYWSGSSLQSLVARSAKWPQGSSGTRTHRTGRRSSDPSRSKACGRIQHGGLPQTLIPCLLPTRKKLDTVTLGDLMLSPHRFMVAASKLKMSKSQESSFSMVWAIRGGMSFNDRGVIRLLGMWWGSASKGTDERG